MSASPLDYVDVTISRDIAVVSRVGFGSLLFVGTTEGKQTPRIAEYADFDAVAEVFDSGDPEFEAAQVYFGQAEKPERLFIAIKEDLEDFSEAIQAASSDNDDWYAVAIASRDSTDIEDVASYIQTQDKLFLAGTADAGVVDPQDDTDIASVLLDLTLDRTGLFYHAGADLEVFPEVAWAGLMLPKDPGSATWAWKTLSGIPSDSLTSTERSTLEDKRATYYVTVAGNNVTFEGQVSEPGVFIDIIRGSDWLRFRMAEDIVAQLASSDKVPYIGGDAIINSLIRTRLDTAVDRDVIAPDYEVTVPPASEQSADDRANRVYNNVTFQATLTGAVHRVRIRGTVTV